MLRVVLFGVGLTAAIELLCCLFRFGFGFRAREIQRRWIGIRLHHGYLAAPLLAALPFSPAPWLGWIVASAAALVVSDLLHHLVVLPWRTGQRD